MRPTRLLVILLFCSFHHPETSWADYEIYRTDGFEKVHEVLEQKENPDGTFIVKARKSRSSNEVVEIYNVVEVKNVEEKSGPQYMDRTPPTPVPKLTQTHDSSPASKSGGEDVPWVRQLSRTVVIGIMAIVVGFILLFVWVKSSN